MSEFHDRYIKIDCIPMMQGRMDVAHMGKAAHMSDIYPSRDNICPS